MGQPTPRTIDDALAAREDLQQILVALKGRRIAGSSPTRYEHHNEWALRVINEHDLSFRLRRAADRLDKLSDEVHG